MGRNYYESTGFILRITIKSIEIYGRIKINEM